MCCLFSLVFVLYIYLYAYKCPLFTCLQNLVERIAVFALGQPFVMFSHRNCVHRRRAAVVMITVNGRWCCCWSCYAAGAASRYPVVHSIDAIRTRMMHCCRRPNSSANFGSNGRKCWWWCYCRNCWSSTTAAASTAITTTNPHLIRKTTFYGTWRRQIVCGSGIQSTLAGRRRWWL